MSSHRAPNRRSILSGGSSNDSPAGQRRAKTASGLRPKATWIVTGAAIGLATIGGLAAVQPDSSATTDTASRGSDFDYVTDVAPAAAEARDTTAVSRAGTRPALGTLNASMSALGDTSAAAAARQDAQARMQILRQAADRARSYGDKLERQQARREAQRRADAREARKAERLSNTWVLPTTGFHISTTFGEAGPYWSSGYHTGLDLATAYGTPVVAVTSATVAQTGYDGAYGNQIRLELENGDQVWYNHLSSIGVSTGQTVSTGEQIGQVGETGNAYGAHLHLEYRLASDLDTGVDPMPFLLEHGLKL